MSAVEIDFFRFTVTVQKVCGFSVAGDGTFKIENNFRFFLFVIYPITIFYPTEVVMTVYNTNNLTNFIKVFVNSLTHFGITFKVITYYLNRVEILYCIDVMKSQKYDFVETKIVLEQHKVTAEKWSKAFLIIGSCICFFMAASAIYIVMFEYQPLGKDDIILFPNFGNTKLGFALFWLYQIIPLGSFLWCTVGKFLIVTQIHSNTCICIIYFFVTCFSG